MYSVLAWLTKSSLGCERAATSTLNPSSPLARLASQDFLKTNRTGMAHANYTFTQKNVYLATVSYVQARFKRKVSGRTTHA